MTKDELIEALEPFDGDALIYVTEEGFALLAETVRYGTNLNGMGETGIVIE